MRTIILFLLTAIMGAGCTVVRPGQVGVKQRLGKLIPKVRPTGIYALNPFTTKMIKVPVRTMSLFVAFEGLPSKEGLSIQTELTVLYHVQPESVLSVIQTIGVKNAPEILMSVARSAAADVSARYFAKDLHTSERHKIERAIADEMTRILGDRGLVVENVLLKSIKLPPGLTKAIEEKLAAEQQAQRMEFVLKQEQLEAERKRIEAEGINAAQKILSQSLNENLLKYKAIEAFRELSVSPNAKTIILNGNAPYIIDPSHK
jgi:regulator of protease activity HflC (stomatin/prohibitin superfamily)